MKGNKMHPHQRISELEDQYPQLIESDLAGFLSQMVLIGEKFFVYSPTFAKKILDLLPNKELFEVYRAGTYLVLEDLHRVSLQDEYVTAVVYEIRRKVQ